MKVKKAFRRKENWRKPKKGTTNETKRMAVNEEIQCTQKCNLSDGLRQADGLTNILVWERQTEG